MADLDSEFQAASRAVQGLEERPDNAALLKLYALYKQATLGDVQGGPKGLFDVAGRAKHNAWASLKGTERDQAKRDYIDFVAELRRAD